MALRAICKAFQIELTDNREQAIQDANLDELNRLRDRILRLHTWPN